MALIRFPFPVDQIESPLISTLGACGLIFAAIMLSRLYRTYLKSKREEGRELLLMIERIRDGVDYYLTPIKDVLESLAEQSSICRKMHDYIAQGKKPYEAYLELSDGLRISKDGKEILDGFFSRISAGYREGVVAVAEEARVRFAAYLETSSEEDEKSGKMVSALLVGGALAFVLLFI